ncbi:MAG: hypothetical protein ABJA57_03875 [Ginsengibacter sp.]
MKYSKLLGITTCILLIVSCFLPWTYHADINKNFTGFFSEKNIYGRPGKFLVFFALASIFLILVQKVWAKRSHLFLSALTFGYAIRTFILFTSCYNTYCPDKKAGIWLMVASCFLILIASLFPKIKLVVKKE